MNIPDYEYLLLTGLLINFTLMAIIATYYARNFFARLLLMGFYFSTVVLGLFGTLESLGRDKPMSLAKIDSLVKEDNAKILWEGTLNQEKRYIVVKFEEISELFLYSMPFEKGKEKELQGKKVEKLFGEIKIKSEKDKKGDKSFKSKEREENKKELKERNDTMFLE